MGVNTYGTFLRVTTFGESHGPALGVVIDGVPPRVPLDLTMVQAELDHRRPGRSPQSSSRDEADRVRLVSGIFDGRTTGAPLALLVVNRDACSRDYDELAQVYRPGHADLTWQGKFGIRDHRGGGRASGRETLCRVAAGAVARQLLSPHGVRILAHVVRVGPVRARRVDPRELSESPLRCGDPLASGEMIAAIVAAQRESDSLGGEVELRIGGVPRAWLGHGGEQELLARLGEGLMSIGAVKGLAQRRTAPRRRRPQRGAAPLELVLRLAVKPTPSIGRPQRTVRHDGSPTTVSVTGRHDPCIAPRLAPVAEAMAALTLADAMLAGQARAPLGVL